MGYLNIVYSVFLEKCEAIKQVEDKGKSICPEKLSTADHQYLRFMSLRNRKIQQRPQTGPARCIWPFS